MNNWGGYKTELFFVSQVCRMATKLSTMPKMNTLGVPAKNQDDQTRRSKVPLTAYRPLGGGVRGLRGMVAKPSPP